MKLVRSSLLLFSVCAVWSGYSLAMETEWTLPDTGQKQPQPKVAYRRNNQDRQLPEATTGQSQQLGHDFDSKRERSSGEDESVSSCHSNSHKNRTGSRRERKVRAQSLSAYNIFMLPFIPAFINPSHTCVKYFDADHFGQKYTTAKLCYQKKFRGSLGKEKNDRRKSALNWGAGGLLPLGALLFTVIKHGVNIPSTLPGGAVTFFLCSTTLLTCTYKSGQNLYKYWFILKILNDGDLRIPTKTIDWQQILCPANKANDLPMNINDLLQSMERIESRVNSLDETIRAAMEQGQREHDLAQRHSLKKNTSTDGHLGKERNDEHDNKKAFNHTSNTYSANEWRTLDTTVPKKFSSSNLHTSDIAPVILNLSSSSSLGAYHLPANNPTVVDKDEVPGLEVIDDESSDKGGPIEEIESVDGGVDEPVKEDAGQTHIKSSSSSSSSGSPLINSLGTDALKSNSINSGSNSSTSSDHNTK